jgi:putative membrane protein
MRYLIRLLWAVLFLFLLSFTAKNTEIIVLRYYFNYEWQAPLILALFFLPLALQLVFCLGKLFRQGGEISMIRNKYSVTDERK